MKGYERKLLDLEREVTLGKFGKEEGGGGGRRKRKLIFLCKLLRDSGVVVAPRRLKVVDKYSVRGVYFVIYATEDNLLRPHIRLTKDVW